MSVPDSLPPTNNLEEARSCATSLLPDDSAIDTQASNETDVNATMYRRFKELQEQFPVGSKVSFKDQRAGVVTGVVDNYFRDESGSGRQHVKYKFTIANGMRKKTYPLAFLARAKKIDEEIDQGSLVTNRLRQRIAERLSVLLRGTTFDFGKHQQAFVGLALHRLTKTPSVDPTEVPDDSIDAMILKIKDKSGHWK